MECLAKRLRERRESLGLSQDELADLMRNQNATRAQISHYECNRRTPAAAAIKDLAKALKCSSDWLLGLSETDRANDRLSERKR